ncbi:MAG: hypothetical protein MJ132_02675 [Clostridia bacterium]|nr:hypothetical protein [Clostridia bacterium]
MKKAMSFVTVCLLFLCAVLGGCGKKAAEEPAKKAAKADVSQLEIKISDKAVTEMQLGESLSCRDGQVTDTTVDEKETTHNGLLSVNRIGVDNTLAEVLSAFSVAPGQASIGYEYDVYGDGTTEMGSEIYSGTLPDMQKLSALDVTVSLYFHRLTDNKWAVIDLNQNKIEDFSQVLAVTFDAEGVHELYGKNPGTVFSVTCTLFEN